MSGFTLMEVLVALIVGTVIVGGVMGLLSVSMQYRKKVEDKRVNWPLLEAAAQEILADPEAHVDEDITLSGFPDEPEVKVDWQRIDLEQDQPGDVENATERALYHVVLTRGRSRLELDFIAVPEGAP